MTLPLSAYFPPNEHEGKMKHSLILAVFTKEGTIVRYTSTCSTIYGTWKYVLDDIQNMTHFDNVIIKVY